MKELSPKEEMQQIITNLIATNNTQAISESVKIYSKSFGIDDFCLSVYSNPTSQPLISLICLDISDEDLEHFLSTQTWHNLEIARATKENSYEDIIDYIKTTPSKYICFLENNHLFSDTKILNMFLRMEQQDNANVCISPRNFVDHTNRIIAHADPAYKNALQNTLFSGKAFLEHNINNHINLYGNLSTIMVATSYARQIDWDIPCHATDSMYRISLLYQFLIHGSIFFTTETYVSTILIDYKEQNSIEKEFVDYISSLVRSNKLVLNPDWKKSNVAPLSSIAREITFFYTDKGEFYNLKPIYDEAQKRGFAVKFTENLTETAEIGIYCQHVCFPENSKFSVILLHDMAQGHNRWPNIWEIERWNQFDLGILPGDFWADLWSQCACQYYAVPRHGAYQLGYPKSDLINAPSQLSRVEELRKSLNLKYDFSVLYAPSWENDEKEDDFVRALASLKVNLLIKQAHWHKAYQHIIDNISKMRELHENKYDNVYYIDPEESIMTALALCDVVVSDESSVMAEAVMFHKPSIAVTDWLIPDCTPSRFASVPMNYVIKCKKVELREYIENLYSKAPSSYDFILQKGKQVFSNQGSCCKDILDAIEYYTNQGTDCHFLSKKVTSKYTPCSMWN